MTALLSLPSPVVREDVLPTWREATKRYSLYYVRLAQANARAFEKLDRDFGQMQAVVSWLTQQRDTEPLNALLDLVKALAPYMQRRALNALLSDYCKEGLRAVQQTQVNPGSLFLLHSEACWALGEWEQARTSVEAAIQAAQGADSKTYAQAVLALGRLELNRGEYRPALQTLTRAEKLLADLSDYQGVATAKAEIAAYYLNRDEYRRALTLYQQVDEIRQRIDPENLSDHTLLMLGVVYRRLKDYDRARANLEKLVQLAEAQHNPGAEATGKHHLAWVYFDQEYLDEAEALGLEAKAFYVARNDPRGASDADEQLGVIAMERGDWRSAQTYLEDSLRAREQLGNQHGMASSLRRLAKLHLKQGDVRIGLSYLSRSLSLYQRLGVLSMPRLRGMLVELTE